MFKGSAPTQEEWLVVLLLNPLAVGEYEWLSKGLLGFMTNSKIQTSAEDIIEWIETEHQGKVCNQVGDTAMAAKSNKSTQPKPKHKC